MFIELTDHLRCPAEHPEQFLVLLPGLMEDRSVRAGLLGCPTCGREYPVANGVADFGGAPDAESRPTALEAEAIAAFAGVNGPGGYLALVGGSATTHLDLSARLPGVALVAINPPSDVSDAGAALSVLRCGSIPLKRGSMRGVVLGPGYADDPQWVREAARVVLPGLRVVGEGSTPDCEALEILAAVEGCWVATRARGGV